MKALQSYQMENITISIDRIFRQFIFNLGQFKLFIVVMTKKG